MEIKKVLMADDDRSMRRIAQIVMTNAAQWEVDLASSGFEALEKIQSNRPDVILLDVMMPGMDGLTTLNKIRESLECDIPVIFLTAKAENDDIQRYENLGIAGVITKPFEPTHLTDQIIKLVSSWERERQAPLNVAPTRN